MGSIHIQVQDDDFDLDVQRDTLELRNAANHIVNYDDLVDKLDVAYDQAKRMLIAAKQEDSNG